MIKLNQVNIIMRERSPYLICFILLFSNYINGQVIATGDTVLCDGQQGNVEVVLSATSYAVDLTDSNIYSDDVFGGVIDMGFDFIFYGNTYNQVVLASNNYLSFNTGNAGGYSDWTVDYAIPTTQEPEVQNAILCPWQDIYPGVNGNGIIAYATTGEAPNRVFIASFCGIPMFSCTDICYSSQIKLFESTNIIETHIAQKVLCTTWNGGAAIHGLHNQDGSIAHVVTGLDGIERNFPNQWTCENDGWRFTPNGDNDYTIENIEFAPAVAGTDITWQDEFGNIIGTGSEITVIPGGNVTYTAGASLCGDAGDWCGFEGGIEGDDVTIAFEELEINGDDTDIICYNANNGTIELIAPSTGNWLYNLYFDGNLISSEASTNSNFTFNNLAPGIYSGSITELTSDCISEELIFELLEPTEINVSFTETNISCFNGEDGAIELEINGGTYPYNTILGDDSGIIEEQEGSFLTFNNLSAGDYYFSTLDENGCLVPGDEVFFTITEPLELIISAEAEAVTCEDAQNGSIDITVIGGTPEYEYSWTSDNGFTSSNQDINQIAGGVYTINVNDLNGCSNTLTLEITENEEMLIDGITSECISNDGTITINTVGGTPAYQYNLITDGATIATNNQGVFTNLEEGEYSVLVLDLFACEAQAEFTLNSRPFADFSIDEYEFMLSNTPTNFTDLSIDSNISSWEWDFGDGNSSNEQNPSYLYTEPGSYYITLSITDEYGCEDEIKKEIQILQDYYSYTPDVFTPNNDGVNDTFSPSLLNIDMNTYNLRIYDRWGKEIFETNNYEVGWDGKLQDGTMLPPDVYSYKIIYTTNLGEEKKETGKITMAR